MNEIFNRINEFEALGFTSLLTLIKEYKEYYKDNLNTNEFFNIFGKHFKKEFEDLFISIQEDIQNNPKDKLTNLYELLESISNEKQLDFKLFLSLCNLGQDHPIVQSFVQREQDNASFLTEVISNIKKWKNSGQSLLNSIKNFRMTPEGRKCINRKSRLNLPLEDEFLENFISTFQVSERAEIYTRIEKYIQSGWFEKDNPLKDYYDGRDDTFQAIAKLKSCMGERFFEAEVKKNQIGKYFDYELVLHENKKLGEKVFNRALSNVKDFCIKSVDGKKIYIGDVTTQETGYRNDNSWLSTLKAINEYKKENNIDVEYSVSIMSLFYDINNNSDATLKNSFIEKFENFSQTDVNDWHLIQFLAVLDRDSQDFKYNLIDLFKDVNLHLFGSASEGFCNNVFRLEEKEFFEKIFSSTETILDKLVKNDCIYNAQRMETNVESIPIHLLLATIKGMQKLVIHDDELSNKYCTLKTNVRELSKKVVHGGHIYEELRRLVVQLTPAAQQEVKNIYLEDKEEFDLNKIKIEEEKEYRKNLLKNNLKLHNEIKNDYEKLIKGLDCSLKKIINSQSETWSKNYTDAFSNILRELSNIDMNKEMLKCSVGYNRQTIDKRNNAIKIVISEVANALNSCYYRDPLYFLKKIEGTIECIEKLVDNPQILKKQFFPTLTTINTQNKYSIYGRFLYDELGADSFAEGQKLEEKYFKNIEALKDVISPLKEKLDEQKRNIENLNSNMLIKPKI